MLSAFLNKAIKIDSNYFIAYSNKMQFQMQLKQVDSALGNRQSNDKTLAK
jgi:uncharacterized protein (AIM24 family)